MKFHKEGRKICLIQAFIAIAIILAMLFFVQPWNLFHYIFATFLILLSIAVALFFRMPRRVFTEDSQSLMAPADGTIVVIEETYEKDYIKDECMMVSIFMSATDVHVNRYPCDGLVEYVKYQKGNYFVASYPKSSTLNERCSVGIKLPGGQKILVRQIAGVMARRIVCYAHEGEQVKQNQELGFIKFGSRVDIFVPKNFDINVDLHDTVRNGITPIITIQ